MCRRVFVRPFVQSICAALIGWVVGSAGMVAVMVGAAMGPAIVGGQGGLGAASVGLDKIIGGGIVAAVGFGSSQLALWRLSADGRTVLNRYLPIGLGAASALATALLATRGFTLS